MRLDQFLPDTSILDRINLIQSVEEEENRWVLTGLVFFKGEDVFARRLVGENVLKYFHKKVILGEVVMEGTLDQFKNKYGDVRLLLERKRRRLPLGEIIGWAVDKL